MDGQNLYRHTFTSQEKINMKQKTKKSVLKRFKLTGSGKLVRKSAFGRHNRSSKSARQIRRYNIAKVVTNKRIARRMKRLMALA